MKKALLLCVLAAPGVAAAADGDQFYVTPYGGGITPDIWHQADHSDGLVGLDMGGELGPLFNLEADLNGATIPGRGRLPPGHFDLDAASLDLLVVGSRAAIVSPYFGVGLGAIRSESYVNGIGGSRRDDNLLAQAKAGLMIRLWESSQKTASFALRPELTLRWDDPGEENRGDFLWTMGFQFAFGGSPVARATPVAATEPPPPPPPPAPPPPPPPPPPAAPPPAPAMVFKGSIILEGVNFAWNSADLTAASRPVLDTVADGLKKHTGVKVEIQGHTDSTGTAAYNIKLSQRRADAVRDYLVKDGVDTSQMVTKGYGAAQPIASNKTAAGRLQNRRVVLKVLANPSEVEIKDQGTAQDSGTGQ